jgi:hypothetical protein
MKVITAPHTNKASAKLLKGRFIHRYNHESPELISSQLAYWP